jgi:antitoxin HigA-1
VTAKLYPPVHPGEVLLEDFLKPMGISQYRLAKSIGVPPRRINEIVHGKRRITAETGVRLSRALGLSDPYWITMQANYDLEVEKDSHQAEIDAITPLTA